MSKTIEDKLKLVDETVAFYTTEGYARCTSGEGCKYWQPDKPWGCAVGRLCTLEERIKLNEDGVLGLACKSAFDSLPEHVKEWGYKFLHRLQSLHDHELFNSNYIFDFKREVEKGLL